MPGERYPCLALGLFARSFIQTWTWIDMHISGGLGKDPNAESHLPCIFQGSVFSPATKATLGKIGVL